MMLEKIGVAVITCQRPEFFRQCAASIPYHKIDEFVVVDDSGKAPEVEDWNEYLNVSEKLPITPTFIRHLVNKGVGVSKNDALRHLYDKGCTHIFLLEDDIIIKSESVFDTYIKASRETGILHFNYGPGSPFNRKQDSTIRIDLDTRHLLKQDSEPNPRVIVEYKGGSRLALYLHTVAMFSYFHRDVITKVGYHDESYKNCWEHVALTYKIAQQKMTTPFWWFADVDKSWELLTEAPGAIDNSSIADKGGSWIERVMEGREIFKKDFGSYPNHIKDTAQSDVLKFLKEQKPI